MGALLRSEPIRLEIIGSGLEPHHFHFRPYRLAFEEVIERFYSDGTIDPLSIAEAVGPSAAKAWKIDEREAIDRLVGLARIPLADETSTLEHARIIQRHADYRQLLSIAQQAANEALAQDQDPDAIAGALSVAATRIITGSMTRAELLSYAELGSRWTRAMREEMAARAAGLELGAYFGLTGIDQFVKGLRPTELMILGGDPGVGKSGLAWVMARNFAKRQLAREPHRRVATLILSLEMGEKMSSDRFAEVESSVEGERLRTASITTTELREIATKWAKHRDMPLYLNHSGELRESQIRALCVDAIRRHNVGLVIIDHFRFIKTDERFDNKNDADEQLVKFLKASLAKDLNLAVVCLAHTTKNENRRPVMDDLRGSKMISAFADVVSFLYWPWKALSQENRERSVVGREEYEVIHDKVRQAAPGTGELWMDMATMTIH